jgi:predicted  nucleic acid-binding Zn-ribbon protein
MYSAEVLSQLRSLNWLTQEIRRVPTDSREGALLHTQMEAIRSRLPDSILDHHDRLAGQGKLTAAEISGDKCGACGTKLSVELLGSVAQPGRFGVCPNCGVFLWSERADEQSSEVAARRAASSATNR